MNKLQLSLLYIAHAIIVLSMRFYMSVLNKEHLKIFFSLCHLNLRSFKSASARVDYECPY